MYDYLNLIGTDFVWNPVMDNEFFQTYSSDLLEAGTFPKVAVLAGTNTDEGLNFAQVRLSFYILTMWFLSISRLA